MKVKQGCTRIVFVFRGFVIKMPNFLYCQRHFSHGCYANICERDTWKAWRSRNEKLIPSLWCSWLGFIQIQRRAEILSNERILTEEEVEYFKEITSDIKPSNFGIYKGRLVCVDYV